jgi:hypothetical protein
LRPAAHALFPRDGKLDLENGLHDKARVEVLHHAKHKKEVRMCLRATLMKDERMEADMKCDVTALEG